MEKNGPIIVEAGSGRELKVGDSHLFLKLSSGPTGDKFSVTEYRLLPGFPGPPPHKHKDFEHAWYVLEGDLTVLLDDREFVLTASSFAFIPKKTVHAFSNKSDSVVRLLAVDTPGGFERYYEEIEAAFGNGQALDPVAFREIQRKYDTYPPDYSFE